MSDASGGYKCARILTRPLVSMTTEPPSHRFASFDGVELAWRELGEGRPLVLLHGLFSSAKTNWLKFGTAATLAARGHRVIMLDLRAHGDSAKPHDAASYPADVLARDGEALIGELGLTDYDLGGYSLGGRTVARMLVRGVRPRRAVIAGMGIAGMLDTGKRRAFFERVLSHPGTHERGSGAWFAESYMRTNGGDPAALLPLLGSFVDTTAVELAAIKTPTLVLAGIDDDDNGSAAELAEALGNGTYASMPGDHMSAVVKPELALAIGDFLAA